MNIELLNLEGKITTAELAAKLKGPVRIRYSEDREIGGGTIDEAARVVK